MHFLFYIDGVEIIDVKWSKDSPIINITTYVPDGRWGPNFPEAYGHFTFGNDVVHQRFLKDPVFVNGHDCIVRGPNEQNPLQKFYQYDEDQRPADGTWVG